MFNKDNIIKHIISGDADKAFSKISILITEDDCEDFQLIFNSELRKQITVLTNDYFTNEHRNSLGIIAHEQYSISRNKSIYELLNFLNIICILAT